MKKDGVDVVKFKYVFSQILDLFGKCEGGFTIKRLRESGNWQTFFNVLVDFKKFSEWEFQDRIFDGLKKNKTTDVKAWDVFCEREYARLSV